MSDKILVFVTCASLAEAGAIACALLDQRLVACAAVGAAVESHFTWRGERQAASEIPLTLKTRQDLFPALDAAIRHLHSYETPEIIAVPLVAGSADYLRWMDENLAPLA